MTDTNFGNPFDILGSSGFQDHSAKKLKLHLQEKFPNSFQYCENTFSQKMFSHFQHSNILTQFFVQVDQKLELGVSGCCLGPNKLIILTLLNSKKVPYKSLQ